MECKNILEGYLKFLSKDLIDLEKKGYCEIELPFPKPSGDSIVLKISPSSEGNFLISDDGFMDQFLFNNGLDLWNLSSEKARNAFSYLRKRYRVLSKEKPNVAILSDKDTIYNRLFQMSNVMNELASLKILAPSVQFTYFKQAIVVYFKRKNFEVTYNPEPIKFEWTQQEYSFNLDFLFYKKNIYAKVIASETNITRWALRFNIVKSFFETQNKEITLWAIFNDKAGITSDDLFKWFRDSVDETIAWYSQKEKIDQLIK